MALPENRSPSISRHFSRRVLALPSHARNLAFKALLLLEEGMNAQQALSSIFSSYADGGAQVLSAKDRHLCSDLVYGFLRTERRILAIMDLVLPRRGKLPRPMVLLLGLGIYSLLFQDRIPDHAVVYSTVETVRHLYGRVLSGVCNACLRSVMRQRSVFVCLESFERLFNLNSLEARALFYSVPSWVARLWDKAYGRTVALQLLSRSFERPWTSFRVNANKPLAVDLKQNLITLGGVSVSEWGVAFSPGKVPDELQGKELSWWIDAGYLSFQASGSQRVLDFLGLDSWRAPVCDICAGRGGKTMALLERGITVPLCMDISYSRLFGVTDECHRLGLQEPLSCLGDATLPPLSRWDGHILLDAPCSGLGVLARRPDIRRRSEDSLKFYTKVQRDLLHSCARLLQPGRQLAYVTCTLNPSVNEKCVSFFLENHADFCLVKEWQTPHSHPWLEGMYGALLEKRT